MSTPDLRCCCSPPVSRVVTGVLFGLAPAWSAFGSRADPIAARDRRGGRDASPGGRSAQSLVVAQVALSRGAAERGRPVRRHLSNLRNVNLGFERDSVLLVTLKPRAAATPAIAVDRALPRAAGRGSQAIPGVRSATLCARHADPGRGGEPASPNVEGFQEKPEDAPLRLIELGRAEVLRDARHAVRGRARFRVRGRRRARASRS